MPDPTTSIFKDVPLDEPLTRGETTISSVRLRRPGAPEMRGLALADVLQLDVIALGKLLPRITTPPLTPPDIDRLAPADLTTLGTEVVSFLLSRRAKEEACLET